MRTLALSSAALLLADRTQIRMAADSLLRLCAARSGAPTRLELPLGRVWARSKGPQTDVQLRTPAAVAAVRGTDWDIEVNDHGHTTLTVLSGRIDVFNEQGSVQVGPSEQATVEPGKAPVKRTLVQPRERVQWIMPSALVASRWPELGSSAQAWYAQALHQLRTGQLSDLAALLAQRLKENPHDALAQRLRAETEWAALQHEAALQRILQLWNAQHDTRAAARYAMLLLALDRTEPAQYFVAQALQHSPHSVPLLLAQAHILRLQGDGTTALQRYAQAAEHAQGPAEQAAVYADWGSALIDSGDMHAGRMALARAVQLQPGDADFQARTATAATQALQPQPAQEGYARALAEDGGDYVALAGEGLLALQQGQAERAREQLLKALAIEPRYAQAHTWLAMAEYRLDHWPAAFDALERARQADPKDPIPWQIESMLRNEAGESVAAIAAARQALVRLPYLKSLNPLASNSQGSANLGTALGEFGLEHWARAYAQESYYPLWAGSHFFMANRNANNYPNQSELFQGYLSDPLSLGAGERYVPIFPVQEQEWRVRNVTSRVEQETKILSGARYSGLLTGSLPLAWNMALDGIQTNPRDPARTPQSRSSIGSLGMGARVSDRLNLLFMHFNHRVRLQMPAGSMLDEYRFIDSPVRMPLQRNDFGGSWRWSSQAQTWFKWHEVRGRQSLGVQDIDYGAGNVDRTARERGFMLRHTVQQGSRRWSLGWERMHFRLNHQTHDPVEAYQEAYTVPMDIPWLAYEDRYGPWTWYAQATWPRAHVDWLQNLHSSQSGEAISTGSGTTRIGGRMLPRLGVSYRFGPAKALHAAYIENRKGIGSHTLSPVGVGAIPIDYQYQYAGSYSRKTALQLDWEWDAHNFLQLGWSRQAIAGATYDDGNPLMPPQELTEFDLISTMGPQLQTAMAGVDYVGASTLFTTGRIEHYSAAINHIFSPHWSAIAGYTHTLSKNTAPAYYGNRLPGMERHTLFMTHTLRHGARHYSQATVSYRTSWFWDEANTAQVPAGWTLRLLHGFDSHDRRWSFYGMLSVPQSKLGKPGIFLRARYRF